MRTILLSFISLILFTLGIHLSYAIEVETTYEYYKVKPNSPSNVYSAILNSSPPSKTEYLSRDSQLKTLGEYTPTTEFDIAYDVYPIPFFKRCTVASVDYVLKSHFVLPKLDDSTQYTQGTIDQFNHESGRILRHEQRHEQHWKDGLAELKGKVLSLGLKKQDCDELKDRIFELESEALKSMQYKDLEFDCRTYAKSLGLAECNAL